MDKECPSAIASLNPGMEGQLFWSDNVCVDNPALVLQCPYKPQPNISDSDASCDCLDVQVPSDVLQSLGLDVTQYANYGKGCAPHDVNVCETLYPTADHAMWCCTSWCWVNATCPTARASTLWQGNYWSDHKCELNADAISSCKYDKSCECRGDLPAGTFDGKGSFAADYGGRCADWDSTGCNTVWGSSSGWNSTAGGNEAWHQKATAVTPSSALLRNGAVIPGATSTRHVPLQRSPGSVLAFTSATRRVPWIGSPRASHLGDDPAATYNEATDTCQAQGRRLSGRRRSGGSWGGGSSTWSSRRRSPPAPTTSPRRRSWSKPSAPSARRRAPPPPPPPPVRRRAPPPPVPSPMEARRRTTSMNGQTYTSQPRRRFPGGLLETWNGPDSGDADLRRRRTAAPVPYGYANRPAMMNNYGGTMPQQTPYGYSGPKEIPFCISRLRKQHLTGYNAVPAQKPVNVAMYAAGGAVAGAVVGAGAMHLTWHGRV